MGPWKPNLHLSDACMDFLPKISISCGTGKSNEADQSLGWALPYVGKLFWCKTKHKKQLQPHIDANMSFCSHQLLFGCWGVVEWVECRWRQWNLCTWNSFSESPSSISNTTAGIWDSRGPWAGLVPGQSPRAQLQGLVLSVFTAQSTGVLCDWATVNTETIQSDSYQSQLTGGTALKEPQIWALCFWK